MLVLRGDCLSNNFYSIVRIVYIICKTDRRALGGANLCAEHDISPRNKKPCSIIFEKGFPPAFICVHCVGPCL